MHPDYAAFYTKIDSLENIVKKAKIVVEEFVEMSEGRIKFTPKSIQELNAAIEEARNGKKKV